MTAKLQRLYPTIWKLFDSQGDKTMKNYDFKVTITKNSVITEHNAKLIIDDDFTMDTLAVFVKDFKQALAAIRKAVIAGNHIQAQFTISTYDHWLEDGTPLEQKSFDCWTFDGYSDDREGIYLAADERYTDAAQDIYLDFRSPLDGIMDR